MPASSRKSKITSPAFWDRFVADAWGRRPAVFRDVFDSPICSPQELFEVLRVSADRVRADSKKVFLRFYGDQCRATPVDESGQSVAWRLSTMARAAPTGSGAAAIGRPMTRRSDPAAMAAEGVSTRA